MDPFVGVCARPMQFSDENASSGEIPESTRHKRRKMTVGSGFLRHYVLVWTVMSLAFVFTLLITLYFSMRILKQGPIAPEYIEDLSLIILTNGIFVLLVTLFMGLYTLLLSQRMSGPAQRINRAIKKTLEGEKCEVRVRDNDLFQDLAANLNQLFEMNRQRDWQSRLQGDEDTRRINSLTGVLDRARNLTRVIREDAEATPEIREHSEALSDVLGRLGKKRGVD